MITMQFLFWSIWFCSYPVWATLAIGTSTYREEIDVAKRDGMVSLCE